MRISGLVDDSTINMEGMERGLNKLESIIGTKNLWRSKILSNSLCNKVGNHSNNLRAITKEVNPTHTGVIINKHDTVVMTQNRRVTRGTPNIIVKKIKSCWRGDVITTNMTQIDDVSSTNMT